ncbi:MAG: transposase [Acidobacteria bacterium]|nr:transposase [Acidobacteriota bacterium]
MRQRSLDLTSPAFGKQAVAHLVNWLCQQLPFHTVGTKVNDAVLWTMLCYAAARRTTIEQTAVHLAQVPAANTAREHLRAGLPADRAGLQHLEQRLNQALQSQVPPKLRRRLQKRRVEVALDLTDLPYHGQPAVDEQEIRRSQAKSSTTHFHSYASLQIVQQRQRLTLALTWVTKGEGMAQVVTRLLAAARRFGLRLQCLYADKGFASVAVLRLLRARRLPYIIALPQRGPLKTLCQMHRTRRCSYTFHAGTRQAYPTDVVCDTRVFARQVKTFAYAVYLLGAGALAQVYERYRRRFSIESGYRQSHQVRPRTASRHPGLRLLLFALSLFPVNAWVLYRQVCAVVTAAGQRFRLHLVTLAALAAAWQEAIQAQRGVRPIVQALPLHAIP